MAKVIWLNSSKSSILITKENSETLELSVGNFISSSTYPNGIKLEAFMWNPDNEEGPIGVRYIPWIPYEQRWDSLSWELNGGNKVDWSTVQLINNGVCPEINFSYSQDYIDSIMAADTAADTTVAPDTTVTIDT